MLDAARGHEGLANPESVVAIVGHVRPRRM